MKVIVRIVSITFFLLFQLSFAKDLVLLGFDGQKAPAVEKSFDRLLREQLAITQGIHLCDYIQSQRYRQQINFDNYPVISTEGIESIAKYVQDTTYFAWGTISELKLTPTRRYLFQGRIKAELSILFNIYSLSERKLVFAGNIQVTEYESKGLVFFMPVSKALHISVLEQTELLEKLEFDAVKKSCQIISAIIQSETSRNGGNVDTQKQNEKAINDVTSTPSIEAPTVKKDSIVMKTGVNDSSKSTAGSIKSGIKSTQDKK